MLRFAVSTAATCSHTFMCSKENGGNGGLYSHAGGTAGVHGASAAVSAVSLRAPYHARSVHWPARSPRLIGAGRRGWSRDEDRCPASRRRAAPAQLYNQQQTRDHFEMTDFHARV